jgi:hypothetical protein
MRAVVASLKTQHENEVYLNKIKEPVLDLTNESILMHNVGEAERRVAGCEISMFSFRTLRMSEGV